MDEEFGVVLRELRLAKGYGLRQFAKMIQELPSNLSAMERGSRPPWRTMDKLKTVANHLAIEQGSRDWDRFFLAARRPDALPEDIERLLSREKNLAFLRTVDAADLSDEQLQDLIEHVKRESVKGARKNKHRGDR